MFLLTYTWVVICVEYKNLPETIVTHFDITGNPDGYSSKKTIWFLSSFFTILCFGFIFGAKYIEQVSFPKRTFSKREKILSSKKMLYGGLLLSSVLILITHSTIKVSVNKNDNPMYWIIPTIIGLVSLFIASIFLIKYKYFKNKN